MGAGHQRGGRGISGVGAGLPVVGQGFLWWGRGISRGQGGGALWWGGASAGRGASCSGAGHQQVGGASLVGGASRSRARGRGGGLPPLSPGDLDLHPCPGPQPRQQGRLTSPGDDSGSGARPPGTSANSPAWASPAATIHLGVLACFGQKQGQDQGCQDELRGGRVMTRAACPAPTAGPRERTLRHPHPGGDHACCPGVWSSRQDGTVLLTPCE